MSTRFVAQSPAPPSAHSPYLYQVPQPAPYYQNAPPPNGPAMHHAQQYPYPPHARYPVDPNAGQMPPGQYASNAHYAASVGHVSTRSIEPTLVSSHYDPSQPPYIIHTDDAATKLNDRVRRKCYNCRTTDTSTWRRSSLTPGKVVSHFF